MSKPKWASGLFLPEEQALQERFAEIKPTHTVRGMFMTTMLEALRRAKGDAVVAQAAAAAGFADATWSAMKSYPLLDFHRLRIEVGKAWMPEAGSIEQATTYIGAAAVDIFFESVAGRTMMLLAGKNPHRLMNAAPTGFPVAIADDAQRKYTKVSENVGLFEFVGDRLGPCHQIGVFTAACKTVCEVDVDITVEQKALLDFTFHVTW